MAAAVLGAVATAVTAFLLVVVVLQPALTPLAVIARIAVATALAHRPGYTVGAGEHRAAGALRRAAVRRGLTRRRLEAWARAAGRATIRP